MFCAGHKTVILIINEIGIIAMDTNGIEWIEMEFGQRTQPS